MALPTNTNEHYLVDGELVMHDGAAAVTATGYGQVDGATKTHGVGNGRVPRGMALRLDVSASKSSAADETYEVQVVGSDDDFSTEEVLAAIPITRGDTGIALLPFENVKFGTVYPDLRAKFDLGGTSPSLTVDEARFVIPGRA